MEHENEKQFLSLKNYCNFLIDLGINVSLPVENHTVSQFEKNENKFDTVVDIDNYLKKWQIKNDSFIITRNNNVSSEIMLIMSNAHNLKKFDQLAINQEMDLLNRMFGAIGQNLNDILIINIDEKKINENNIYESKKIISSYFLKVKPKFFIDMSSDYFKKKIDLLNVFSNSNNFFRMPSPFEIYKNENLKRQAWTKLKLLKARLNDV